MDSQLSFSSFSKNIETHTTTDIFLVGPLPACRQDLSVFFHHHKIENKTFQESARCVIREVFHLWNMARIPTTIEHNAIEI